MSKAKRHTALMMTINTMKKFTIGELANQFQVSRRTISRDLQELIEAGMPLLSEVGTNGGYQVLMERMLPPVSFTESEAVAIFLAYQSLHGYSSIPFESESISAIAKLSNSIPIDVQARINNMKDRVAFCLPSTTKHAPLLNDMLQHTLEQNIVSINYKSDNNLLTRILIQPIGVYSRNGLWYCPAYCIKAKEIKVLQIDRIRDTRKLRLRAPNKEITAYKVQQFIAPLED